MEENSAPVALLDGGFSSQLSYHVNTDAEYANHPLWCARYLVTDPESVIKTHRDYIKAGADIITTNTYQASVEGFNKYLQLSSHESYHIIKRAVQLAKEAISQENANQIAKKKVLVAGSIGSYGACLHDGSEYNGNYTKNISKDVLKNWHRPRMAALVESGVDFLAIETIPALSEAEIILELLKEFPSQKAWISFTCENGLTTVAHDRIGYAANELWSTSNRQLVAIGVNCLKPSFVTPLLNAIRAAGTGAATPESSLAATASTISIPTIAYPNSGENYDIIEQRWIKLPGSRTIHDYTIDWLNSGLSIIGGCCRTTAQDVRLMKARVQAFNEAKTRNHQRIREKSSNMLQL